MNKISIISTCHKGRMGSLQSSPFESPTFQFMSNLKREKEISISWKKKEGIQKTKPWKK
jgi:hypothetical protein